MFKGGYKLIDFKENNIALDTSTTIKGYMMQLNTITENVIKVS